MPEMSHHFFSEIVQRSLLIVISGTSDREMKAYTADGAMYDTYI